MHYRKWIVAAVIAAVTASTHAQAPAQPPPDDRAGAASADAPQPAVLAPPVAPPSAVCCVIPAGSEIELEIAQPLSSATHKRGDKFALKLHAPLTFHDRIVVPAGTEGVGEIVHAEASRGGGKPGELLLAARYLRVQDTQVRLRALKFGGSGQDRTKGALAASMALGPFAHFIRGRDIEIPAGTVVRAKLAQDVDAAPPSVPASPASGQSAAQPIPSPATDKE